MSVLMGSPFVRCGMRLGLGLRFVHGRTTDAEATGRATGLDDLVTVGAEAQTLDEKQGSAGGTKRNARIRPEPQGQR